MKLFYKASLELVTRFCKHVSLLLHKSYSGIHRSCQTHQTEMKENKVLITKTIRTDCTKTSDTRTSETLSHHQ